jgi:hypothetical protein
VNVSSQFWWWVARATGIVAWVAATASVVWGLLVSGKLVRRRRLPAWILDLHRYLGTLTCAFVAVHLVALVADSYTDFGLRELFVPMASAWRPFAVAWGVLALYGVVIIQVTSWGMRALPRNVWRAIHMSSYLVFVMANDPLRARWCRPRQPAGAGALGRGNHTGDHARRAARDGTSSGGEARRPVTRPCCEARGGACRGERAGLHRSTH